MAKKLTPDEITERLLKYDPNNDFPVPEEVPPKEEVLFKKSASELLKTFLDNNNIVLSVSPVNENIKTISDGSVILSSPRILVNYKQQ
jgi:ABC-type polysaccharide/polyol phosphate transport system ATPase subunit